MAICSGKKSDSSPCKANTLIGKRRCFWHSKSSKKKLAAAVKKGGNGKKKEKLVSLPRVKNSKDIIKLLNRGLTEIEKVPDPEARATLILRAVNMGTKALMTSELEDRLDAVETKVATLHRGRKQ